MIGFANMNPSQTILKLIVFIHFILTTWASMNVFMGSSYVYMNLIVVTTGVFTIVHHESSDAVLMFLLCHVFSILQDIILLGMKEPVAHDIYDNALQTATVRNEYRFSLGMSILNLILKPLTGFLIFRIYRERGGTYADFSIPGIASLPRFAGSSPQHSGYDNIDTPPQVPQGYEPTPNLYTTTEKH